MLTTAESDFRKQESSLYSSCNFSVCLQLFQNKLYLKNKAKNSFRRIKFFLLAYKHAQISSILNKAKTKQNKIMKPVATCCPHFLPAGHQDVEETPLGLVSGSLCWKLALPVPNYVTLAKSLNLSESQFLHDSISLMELPWGSRERRDMKAGYKL